MTAQPHVIDKSKLPPLFPTHLHDAAFWCSLGRAVATFGFLEEMLKKAHLALTGTYPAPVDEDEAAAAVDEWHGSLERSIIGTLNPLIDTVAKAAKDHPELRHQNLEKFAADLRAAAKVRNLICHGSWGARRERRVRRVLRLRQKAAGSRQHDAGHGGVARPTTGTHRRTRLRGGQPRNAHGLPVPRRLRPRPADG
jgi:hypothetical protein